MTAKDLKNALLQEAVQGKLTEGWRNKMLSHAELDSASPEYNAKALLEQIRKERGESLPLSPARKRSSATPSAGTPRNAPLPISEDEIPFDIPESWCWCRLSEVCSDIADIDHRMPPVCEKGIPYVSPLNFGEGNYIDFENAKKISQKDFEQLSKKCKPERGDIIFPRYGTIGVLRTVETDIDFLVSYSCATIKTQLKNVYRKYIFYVLLSPLTQKNEIQRYINKTTQPNIGLQSIKQFLFPLPPLAEQKRIVEAIEKFMPLIEEYGKKEAVLKELNANIGTLTKKAILQEAVQGKLVPQIPAEGSAKDLLEQIKAQKTNLIKEGKIKKEKPLPEIMEDEIPFDIPENWCWCRLGEVFHVWSARRVHQSDWKTEGIPFFRAREIGKLADDGYVDNELFITEELYSEYSKTGIPEENDLMITAVGTLGKIYIVKKNDRFYYKDASVISFKNFGDIDPFFAKHVMDSNFMHETIKNASSGTTVGTITIQNANMFPFPLPPLAEQKRIVAAIEQLLPLCEKLGK